MLRYSDTMRRDYNLTRATYEQMLTVGRARRREVRDDRTGEVDATLLAESIAFEVGCLAALDDDTHPLWDIAADLAGA